LLPWELSFRQHVRLFLGTFTVNFPPSSNGAYTIYRLAETTIKENFTVDGRDEVMNFLQNSVINEDEFLRYRISERFNDLIISLFDAHRGDPLSPEHTETIKDMKNLVQSYMTDRKTESETKAKFYMLCKQLGLNATQLDEEELRVMMKVLERSPLLKRGGRRK